MPRTEDPTASWPPSSLVVSDAYIQLYPNPDFYPLCLPSPAAHPRSMGLIAGAVAAGAVVLMICIVLVAVALFYWKNKHKEEEEEEIPNEIRWGSGCQLPPCSWSLGSLGLLREPESKLLCPENGG